jgi:hypothetical protein
LDYVLEGLLMSICGWMSSIVRWCEGG